MKNDPFAVWVPTAEKVELVLVDPAGGDRRTLAMEPDGGGFWRPVGGLAEPPADRPLDYGYRLDGSDVVLPDPRARRAQPHGVHGLSRTFDPAAHSWSDQLWTGRQLAGRHRLRAARRHVHRRGDTALGHRPARPSRRPGRRLRRGDAGQRVQRQPQLGLRRGAVVRGPGGVRRPGRVPGLRRRLPPARAGRHPGRRLQPPRPERQLPAGVRALHRTTARRTPGARRSTSTGRTPTRCVATSSTTR